MWALGFYLEYKPEGQRGLWDTERIHLGFYFREQSKGQL